MTLKRIINLSILAFVISISIIASLIIIAISEEEEEEEVKFLAGVDNVTNVTWGLDTSHLYPNDYYDKDGNPTIEKEEEDDDD